MRRAGQEKFPATAARDPNHRSFALWICLIHPLINCHQVQLCGNIKRSLTYTVPAMVAVHGPFRGSLVPCMGGLCVYPQVPGSGMVLPRMAGTHGGGTASGLPFFPSLCSASPLHGRLLLGSMSPPSPSPHSVKAGQFLLRRWGDLRRAGWGT